mmetsp:Transcript_102576/g.203611  ORF Transcript_102576/g.203611 Transcript_102576/m.203611 type:complete len:148 (+) Transcript_102576:143-586(+)
MLMASYTITFPHDASGTHATAVYSTIANTTADEFTSALQQSMTAQTDMAVYVVEVVNITVEQPMQITPSAATNITETSATSLTTSAATVTFTTSTSLTASTKTSRTTLSAATETTTNVTTSSVVVNAAATAYAGGAIVVTAIAIMWM